jgi:hypothetical protein
MTERSRRKGGKPAASAGKQSSYEDVWIQLQSSSAFNDEWLQIPHHGVRGTYQLKLPADLLKRWPGTWNKGIGESRSAVVPGNHEPPWFADFLLIMFLKPSHIAAAIGDLREPFDRECRCLGRRRAVWLYWRRTFNSLWPLLRRAIGKAVKWGAVIAMVKRIFDHTAA